MFVVIILSCIASATWFSPESPPSSIINNSAFCLQGGNCSSLIMNITQSLCIGGECISNWSTFTNGSINFTGIIGPQGPQGIPGVNGSQGPQGNNGSQGPIGPQGPQGVPGVNGSNGSQGPIGPQGSFNLSSICNNNGKLTINGSWLSGNTGDYGRSLFTGTTLFNNNTIVGVDENMLTYLDFNQTNDTINFVNRIWNESIITIYIDRLSCGRDGVNGSNGSKGDTGSYNLSSICNNNGLLPINGSALSGSSGGNFRTFYTGIELFNNNTIIVVDEFSLNHGDFNQTNDTITFFNKIWNESLISIYIDRLACGVLNESILNTSGLVPYVGANINLNMSTYNVSTQGSFCLWNICISSWSVFIRNNTDEHYTIIADTINISKGISWNNYGVCYINNGELGHCTTELNSSGLCSCIVN